MKVLVLTLLTLSLQLVGMNAAQADFGPGRGGMNGPFGPGFGPNRGGPGRGHNGPGRDWMRDREDERRHRPCESANLYGARNETLREGRSILSCNSMYKLVMQSDCNLVVYRFNVGGQVAIWASNTAGRGAGCRAVIQQDGNLVVYTPSDVPVFASYSRSAGATLVMQDDGNLVIYAGRAGQNPIWQSGSAGR